VEITVAAAAALAAQADRVAAPAQDLVVIVGAVLLKQLAALTQYIQDMVQ
jgi:hypothetical protein